MVETKQDVTSDESNTVQLGKLMDIDLSKIVIRLPRPVREVMFDHDVFLGGGFIRAVIAGEEPSDIDLFGNHKNDLLAYGFELARTVKGKAHTSDNAITVLAPPRSPVQFITRWLYADPVKLIESFDFTIAKAVIWYDKADKVWKSMCHERYYPDLAARRLVYTFPIREEAAGGSLLRVCKFLKRGYRILPTDLAGVISRLVGALRADDVDLSDEVRVSEVLTGLLHEVDPLMVVDGIEFRDVNHMRKPEVKETEVKGS